MTKLHQCTLQNRPAEWLLCVGWKWKLLNLTLCNPTDYTVHGILQAKTLEWVAILFSRGSSWPRDWTQVSCIAGRSFTSWATLGGLWQPSSVQFSSVAQLCPTFCNPMNRSTPGLPVHHQLPEFTQTHVHQVSDAIQPSHPLSSPFSPAPNPSQHQSLFQWVNSLHEVAKVWGFWQPKTHKTQTLVSNQLWRKKIIKSICWARSFWTKKSPQIKSQMTGIPGNNQKVPLNFLHCSKREK